MIPLTQDARIGLQEKWKPTFGELVPLTDEELVFIIINTVEEQNNLPFTQWPASQPTDLIVLFLPNNPPSNADPSALPIIEVPSSTFCFFKKEWAKKERMVTPRGNKRNHQGKKKDDPHALLWQSLTDNQKEMWSILFLHRRQQAENLIENGYCTRAPSFNEMKKAERMAKRGK
ncbi:hypothetical protein CAEBREN_03782 [Caenorhabditis brenneri]|uniref:Uncharacterized protein n=1 Tax=Caenorhabditis brenneri TaxID=135651 RepID=G0MDE2_CAEBE|nr:hypothetical protein CAEBREN_03782 [Caenorhabditis brenneri]